MPRKPHEVSFTEALKDFSPRPQPVEWRPQFYRHTDQGTFKDIWERDGQWLMGPGLLSDIIHFQKTRGLQAVRNPRDDSAITITFDLPKVIDEITVERRNVVHMIPPELRPLFEQQSSRALQTYVTMIGFNPWEYLNEQLTDRLIYSINQALWDIENRRRARMEPEFWMHLAEYYGFSPYALPMAAGMAIHA